MKWQDYSEVRKRSTCQAGVYLGYASHKGYALVDRRLYMPQEWVEGLPGPEVWLVLRRDLLTGKLKTYLCNAPANTPLAMLVQLSGTQWPIETCFEDGKQYLGMGDYEVRNWRGWHHHMTLCILAHAFLARARLRLKKSPGLDHPPGAGAVVQHPTPV